MCSNLPYLHTSSSISSSSSDAQFASVSSSGTNILPSKTHRVVNSVSFSCSNNAPVLSLFGSVALVPLPGTSYPARRDASNGCLLVGKFGWAWKFILTNGFFTSSVDGTSHTLILESRSSSPSSFSAANSACLWSKYCTNALSVLVPSGFRFIEQNSTGPNGSKNNLRSDSSKDVGIRLTHNFLSFIFSATGLPLNRK
ncbi:hypothetical protein AYI68_g5045 [Smittium mucronatum]|uniref:Uncharacterized protein n=1 Tax=Smittium mucronatum TaxID=133383 RepID=A0A1R0GVB8_9FUNG|nr:hypothetical protein AYI68_g5045 [Smittium mucronatum]